MTQDEIIEMWKNSGDLEILGMPYSKIEAFAKLVAKKERERIVAKNKPELEKCNAYIRELELRLHASSILRGEA